MAVVYSPSLPYSIRLYDCMKTFVFQLLMSIWVISSFQLLQRTQLQNFYAYILGTDAYSSINLYN